MRVEYSRVLEYSNNSNNTNNVSIILKNPKVETVSKFFSTFIVQTGKKLISGLSYKTLQVLVITCLRVNLPMDSYTRIIVEVNLIKYFAEQFSSNFLV